VPSQEWDALANLNCDAVWLMGVWQRSPIGRQIALDLPDLMAECRRIFPDFTDEDLPGSPYCVKSYDVDTRLGNLAIARAELQARGLKLILDFVPNHVARDHRWVFEHPEFFIQGDTRKLNLSPDSYFEANGAIIACGRDPYFPPWTDTAQVNAFSPGLRKAALDTLRHIATECDGVRCDMSMLELNSVFARTWGDAAGPVPEREYWTELIEGVRAQYPDFLFFAEAYWNLEGALQELGFDYCYDKRIYDRLRHGDAQSIRDHLRADIAYQQKLLRFLENHDERRAAAAFAPDRLRAAAVVSSTLPGAMLYHDGQFCGAKTHIPVQLGRAPVEACDLGLAEFYKRLRACAHELKSSGGQWTLCEALGWPDNQSANHLICWTWYGSDLRCLVVVNYSDRPAQGRLFLPWANERASRWRLQDALTEEIYDRDPVDLQTSGLYVAREGWGFHVLIFEPKQI
jgi:hypothetical protein